MQRYSIEIPISRNIRLAVKIDTKVAEYLNRDGVLITWNLNLRRDFNNWEIN